MMTQWRYYKAKLQQNLVLCANKTTSGMIISPLFMLSSSSSTTSLIWPDYDNLAHTEWHLIPPEVPFTPVGLFVQEKVLVNKSKSIRIWPFVFSLNTHAVRY